MSELAIQKDSNNKLYLRRALISGSIMLSSYLMKQGLEAGYKKLSGKDAPKNPKRQDSSWMEALLWAAATGAVLGLAKTLLRTQVRAGVDSLIEKWT